jgi:hypothetical protein
MRGLLPRVSKNRVDRTVAAVRKQIRNELAVTAEFIPDDEHSNVVCLAIYEGDAVQIKIELRTGSQKDARQICKNWKERTQELYFGIVDVLTRP